MGFIMDLDTPSNADIIRNKLLEDSSIDLYPKDEEKYDPLKSYREYYELREQNEAKLNKMQAFKEEVKNELLSTALYQGFLNPVLESFYAKSHEKILGRNLVSNFVESKTPDALLSKFKYQNTILAEVAFTVNHYYDNIINEAGEKIKKGLSEDDIYEIEDDAIKDMVLDVKSAIPKDVTKVISKRVQNSIEDFIDNKKKSQSEIKNIYDKAKEKIDQYIRTQDFMNPYQSDAETQDGMDPDVAANDNLANKLNMQQAQADQQNAYKEEVMREARYKESMILESGYCNIFDAMLSNLVESIHKVGILKEAYSTDHSGVNVEKAFNDTRVMYAWLECVNTTQMEDIDEKYLTELLKETSDTEGMMDAGSTSGGSSTTTNSKPSDPMGGDTTKVTQSKSSSAKTPSGTSGSDLDMKM